MGENNYNSCFLLRIPVTYLQSPAWKISPWWTLGRYILSIPERFWRLGRFMYEQHFHCKLHTLILLLLVVLLLSLAEQPWANHSALGGQGALFSIHESLGSSWRISSFLYVKASVAVYFHCRSAVPNLFGTRDQFHGRQFFHRGKYSFRIILTSFIITLWYIMK